MASILLFCVKCRKPSTFYYCYIFSAASEGGSFFLSPSFLLCFDSLPIEFDAPKFLAPNTPSSSLLLPSWALPPSSLMCLRQQQQQQHARKKKKKLFSPPPPLFSADNNTRNLCLCVRSRRRRRRRSNMNSNVDQTLPLLCRIYLPTVGMSRKERRRRRREEEDAKFFSF